MKITKGTNEAEKLLERLRVDGELVDVYSQSFFQRQPSIDEDPYAPFSSDGMDYVEDLENDPDGDVFPKGHLLFIFLNDYKPEIRQALSSVYPPLENLLDNGKHNPDFLILNLYTQQMLCVGLGRKNRLFVIDAATQEPINAFGLIGHGDHDDYIDKFTEHDCYETVSDFLHAVHDLGQAMSASDNVHPYGDCLEHTLDAGPGDDGLFYIKSWDDELLDDEGYSREDLTDMVDRYRQSQEAEETALKMVRVFFPQCERAELNTGDY